MRGQSAIEFLTTYSWAFLILGIFVSAVALLSLSSNQGVTTFMPSSCYVAPSLPCSQAIVSGNSMGSTFIVILKNNMGVKIHFSTNSIQVKPSVYTSNTYSGICLPQNALIGSTFICSVPLSNFNPPVGSQLNPTFALSYQICSPSCTAQVYNTSGTALTAMTPYRAIISNVVLLASPSSGIIALGGIRYNNGVNMFLITGISYPISALPPAGYGFNTWIATANFLVGNTISASTTLKATGLGSLTANFLASASSSTTSTTSTSISSTTTVACFAFGTPILTPSGSEPIQNMSVGDEVLSYNSSTGQIEQSQVTGTYMRPTQFTYTVETELGTVVTTRDHPFYVGNNTFVRVANLSAGENVGFYENGTLVLTPIESIRIELAPQNTYNLEVANTHTYFADGFAVHNK